MESSTFSDIRMKLLLFAIILGHLNTIHTTEVSTLPQISSQTENDILQEVETDGFLVQQIFHSLLTTKTPEKTTTVQAADNPSPDFNHFLSGDLTEGSTSGDVDETDSRKLHGHDASIRSSFTAVLQTYNTNSTSVSSVNLIPQPELTSTSTANVYNRRISAGDNSVTQKTDHKSFMFSETGSHNTESSTQSQTTDTSGASQSIKETLISSANMNTAGAMVDPSSSRNGHTTPDWIIILGFIVGVAALIMLCVAIATREKWNRPRQALEKQKNTGSTYQQRELEMETLVQHHSPKENGKAAEYTVISLDELPDKYTQ